MKTITEEDIERWVRFPETLSDSEKEKIRSAVNQNKEFQQLADWFSEFYDELDALAPKKSSNTLIRLTPISNNPTATEENKPLVFAAMSPAPKGGMIETVATLASEEDQTVARVLRNQEEEAYKIHLIRKEQPDEDEKTIFTIEDLNMDLVLDESRHLSVKGNSSLDELNWERSAYSLRIPIGKCEIGEQEIKSGAFSKEIKIKHHRVSIRAEDEQLIITIDQIKSTAPVISRVLITGRKSASRLLRLDGEKTFRVNYQKDEALIIQFYR